ncbi:putative oxidoreductase [Caulobacter ginsengisoli]|uniref:Oxidoreductase n=1 Tax=Caulobacter ginsengisoli TaxID=400775 RepID=A0ABU0IQ38_9CAUL|nr:DoxX family protein [Caulobacter ginsengisoli]MDQ0463067.1 putative oxidoreductase [Caulobacter ginsengisoli]
MPNLAVWSPRLLSVLRIMAALLFMEHGLMKLFAFPGPQPAVPDPLPVILVVAAWLEVIGGGLLALGAWTRPVAFILSGEMAVAYFTAHVGRSGTIFPALNGGDGAVLFCFIFLYLAAAGGGEWSVDAQIRKRP